MPAVGALTGRLKVLGREEPLKVPKQEAGSGQFSKGYSGCW